MDKFTHNVVQNIVDYVGAAQVAMYVNKQIEDEHREKDTFDLKALMAYGKIVKLDKTFQNGHELLGRVTLENRTIYMEGLPIRYVKLSPGMQDEKRPTNLLITPININENALGVIEILSFDKWEPHQIDFIEKLCENIASVVASVKTNLRTEKLLQQSQYQADELAQHEEEMRQNLEEMEATQEEANKRQDELNSYLKAIKGSIMTAELDLNGRIIDISPAMSLAYGASMDNMRGKFYDAFVAQNKESQDEFREFWEALINSGSGKRMQKFKQRNKEAVLLESYLVIQKL
jgi:methyl-accepting chemotaxis protein